MFDFDGTLVDSNALKREAFFQVLAGPIASASQVAAVLADLPTADRLGIITETLRRARGLPPDSAEVGELSAAYNGICEAGAAECAEMPGASDLLRTLRSAAQLHLNSATPEESLRRIIKRRGWMEFFTSVYGRPGSKLANLRRIAHHSGVAAKQMVLVGDGVEDVEAAREFGCPFVAVGSFARDSWPATPYLTTLSSLPAWLATCRWTD